jgi:choline dehydrogenase
LTTYDYVIVGGGSAGCIVAAELAQSAARPRVLLLEAGPAAEEHPATLEADGYKDTFVNDSVFYDRFTAPQRNAGDQKVFIGTGKVLGGSGSVNGMVYTRGAKEDYDEWPKGWRWDDVKDDFAAVEARLRVRKRPATDFTRACISAAEGCGFRHSDDLNDGNLSNVIGHEFMSYEGDRRRSSYVAFLQDAGAIENLEVRTGARVHKVVVKDGRATGVDYEDSHGPQHVSVRREVVLSAGALETPRLLMLSGLGPSQTLRAAGVPLVADLQNVGQNLHDHPNLPVFFKSKNEVDCHYPQLYSFYRTRPESDLPPGQSDSCYVFWPARSAMKQAMQRMLPSMMLPDSLYKTRARQLVRGGVSALFKAPPVNNFVDRMFGIIIILGKPKSRGSVSITSTDPNAPAVVDPRYLEHPEDKATLVQGVSVARKLAQTAGLSDWGAKELMPGPMARDEAALGKWVEKNIITTYHYVGTCSMGTNGSSATDLRLRLKGVSGIRVADASAIPSTPVSALNAPSMLVGYRAARYLLEDAPN